MARVPDPIPELATRVAHSGKLALAGDDPANRIGRMRSAWPLQAESAPRAGSGQDAAYSAGNRLVMMRFGGNLRATGGDTPQRLAVRSHVPASTGRIRESFERARRSIAGPQTRSMSDLGSGSCSDCGKTSRG